MKVHPEFLLHLLLAAASGAACAAIGGWRLGIGMVGGYVGMMLFLFLILWLVVKLDEQQMGDSQK